jgi:hypothetical protein
MRGRGKAALVRHRPELLASIGAFAVSSFFLSHAYYFVFFALIGFIEVATQALRVSEAVGAGTPVVVQQPARRRGGIVPRRGPGFLPGELPPAAGR